MADIANGYVDRILAQCRKLADIPYLGTPRDDLTPGVRLTGFEKRVNIIYRACETHVEVIAIAYGGRDLAKLIGQASR